MGIRIRASAVDCASRSIKRKDLVFYAQRGGELAHQKSSGRLHLYMYTDLAVRPLKRDRLVPSYEFDRFLISNRVADVFGI